MDVTAVNGFVHMAGHNRRFVPKFAGRAAPLTKLLRKAMGNRAMGGFPGIEERVDETADTRLPGLHETNPPDLGCVTSVARRDADTEQCGEQPIAYTSKTNSDAVVKYGTTDLECVAVLFRSYVYGWRFELVTDHAALKWLMTSKDLMGRLHRPGASNVVADALSRTPVNAVVA
ncbi:Retrovirus Polyprotein [Phytophthora megakarya]|uniref:Retrovirus Polyprotein n=1 Tax=Phytophthora megakarya TaxID=4795 RepID=A0A225WCT0_9STRA|nr:Retrovirus Polyprotein [Phytophthora megakarya]